MAFYFLKVTHILRVPCHVSVMMSCIFLGILHGDKCLPSAPWVFLIHLLVYVSLIRAVSRSFLHFYILMKTEGIK